MHQRNNVWSCLHLANIPHLHLMTQHRAAKQMQSRCRADAEQMQSGRRRKAGRLVPRLTMPYSSHRRYSEKHTSWPECKVIAPDYISHASLATSSSAAVRHLISLHGRQEQTNLRLIQYTHIPGNRSRHQLKPHAASQRKNDRLEKVRWSDSLCVKADLGIGVNHQGR